MEHWRGVGRAEDGERTMRYRSMIVGAVPVLAAAVLLQPRAEPVPTREPSAAQIDAAVRYAQRDAGLDGAHRR
jgi:hypothetical protein